MVRKAEKQNLEILANLAVQQNHLFRKDIIKECREVVYRDTPLHFFVRYPKETAGGKSGR